MTEWSEDEHEQSLVERRWPLAPTHLLPRERWLWWEQLLPDGVFCALRARRNAARELPNERRQ